MSDLGERLYDQLMMLAWSLNSACSSSDACSDFSIVDYLALKTVGEQQGCPVQTIGKTLGITKSGATRIVKRLESRDLLKTHSSPEDGRVRCLKLTESGQNCLIEIQRYQSERITKALKGMESEQSQQLEQSLQNLLKTLSSE
ncbi:hypothetical protein EOPP23_07130 [Endozoicomonas sp. OPT23]|uniref:MarR family winged helix-turn-helix transcriptional regulator n=1 Tax=Endozoicomonas sp. OPT23 TaxID=2072845 RepID=UPI00129B56C5|nr:MarR family transcriptional regulator [Endozoicomonas sp. OPT23]MRI32759.1 hypothetical protein [Endozoicomonas sp. OPT23]